MKMFEILMTLLLKGTGKVPKSAMLEFVEPCIHKRKWLCCYCLNI